jgi:hypothetical protein
MAAEMAQMPDISGLDDEGAVHRNEIFALSVQGHNRRSPPTAHCPLSLAAADMRQR